MRQNWCFGKIWRFVICFMWLRRFDSHILRDHWPQIILLEKLGDLFGHTGISSSYNM